MTTNEDIAQRSGTVEYQDQLTSFLYELMRDHLTPGVIEKIVRNSESQDTTKYSNGWLAKYAHGHRSSAK